MHPGHLVWLFLNFGLALAAIFYGIIVFFKTAGKLKAISLFLILLLIITIVYQVTSVFGLYTESLYVGLSTIMLFLFLTINMLLNEITNKFNNDRLKLLKKK